MSVNPRELSRANVHEAAADFPRKEIKRFAVKGHSLGILPFRCGLRPQRKRVDDNNDFVRCVAIGHTDWRGDSLSLFGVDQR